MKIKAIDFLDSAGLFVSDVIEANFMVRAWTRDSDASQLLDVTGREHHLLLSCCPRPNDEFQEV
jgi:hypothetical protein